MAPNPESTQRQAEQEHEAHEQQREATPGPPGPTAFRLVVHQRLHPRVIISDELRPWEGNRLSVGRHAGTRHLQPSAPSAAAAAAKIVAHGVPHRAGSGSVPASPQATCSPDTAAPAGWSPGLARAIALPVDMAGGAPPLGQHARHLAAVDDPPDGRSSGPAMCSRSP